jgi:hypothetical protein
MLLCGCGGPEAPAPTTAEITPAPSAPVVIDAATVTPPATVTSEPVATVVIDAGIDAAPPDPPLVKSKTWPFVVWDHAEAFAFNHVEYGPDIPLRVYDEANGWSKNIVEHKPIDQALAKHALELVLATRGEIEVSKCPFPRHAIVFYAGSRPVGTVNVCFTCGDILVWPDVQPPYDWSTAAGERRAMRDMKKRMPLYDKVFPQWEKLFRDDVGYPLTRPPGIEH